MAAVRRARDYVHGLQEGFDIPGMAVAVAIDGSMVWAEGFGYANVEKGMPATPRTEFRIGSVSKVLTAAAVALLYESGALDLDAPIQEYVPEFPAKDFPITTRQLAGHLAGIRHYGEEEEEDKPHFDDVVASLDLFKNDPLLHPPGTKWSYSSYGFNLVGAIVQRASGKPYADYLKEAVFEPLGMARTGPEDPDRATSGRSAFYEAGEPAPAIDVSYKWPSGGFLSTAEDLVRFGSAFLPGTEFVEPDTLRLLFTNQRLRSGEEVPHGIGWFVTRLENGAPLYYHPGSMTGGQAILLIQPADRLVVAMLANQAGGFGEAAATQVACYFLGQGDDECPEIEGERQRRLDNRTRLAMLQTALRGWKRAIEDEDIDALMALHSESFRSARWRNKEAMRRHYERLFASGQTNVDIENLHFRNRTRGFPIGAVTYIEGIEASGAWGEESLRLKFVREESGPMIAAVEVPRLR